MEQQCSTCFYKGIARKGSLLHGKSIPIIGLLIGLAFIWFPDWLITKPATIIEYLTGPLLFIAVSFAAIYLLIDNYKKSANSCPKCGYGKMHS